MVREGRDASVQQRVLPGLSNALRILP